MKLFLPVLIVFSFLQIALAQNQIDHLSGSSSKNTASSSLVSTESEWMKNEGINITNPFENSVRVTLNSLKLNAGAMELLDLNGQILVRNNITVYIG
jgi:hypothetical protein